MTTLLEGVGNEIKEAIGIGDDSTKEELLNVKKQIASEYISDIKKENPVIEMIEDNLLDYLVNEGRVEDVFKDIFRGTWLSIVLPESIDKLNKIKEKLSSLKEVPTSDQLASLKSEIINMGSITTTESTGNISGQESHNNTGQTTSTGQTAQSTSTGQTTQSASTPQTTQQTHTESSSEILDSEKEFVKAVFNKASSQIGVKYQRAGTKPETGFDCSGLWNWAFKEVGIKFKSRMTAHTFSDANVNIPKKDVQVGDFMFRDQKPGSKKHNSIYHIEMVVSKPYTKNGKTYVRTLGSSTDTKDDRGNYVGNGVRFREREMKDYRHYGRPTYYYQLALHEQTGNNSDLIADANAPTQQMKDNVLTA